jgi:hypothetical protein
MLGEKYKIFSIRKNSVRETENVGKSLKVLM